MPPFSKSCSASTLAKKWLPQKQGGLPCAPWFLVLAFLISPSCGSHSRTLVDPCGILSFLQARSVHRLF